MPSPHTLHSTSAPPYHPSTRPMPPPSEIKNELKKKDDEFVKTLKRQAEDIDTLIQYMSRQFVELQNAYKEELDEIESAFLQVIMAVICGSSSSSQV